MISETVPGGMMGMGPIRQKGALWASMAPRKFPLRHVQTEGSKAMRWFAVWMVMVVKSGHAVAQDLTEMIDLDSPSC